MQEEPKPSENRTPTTETAPNIQVPKPLYPPEDEQQAEQHFETVEEKLSGFERSTLRWTKATFGIVTATGLFICLQWCEMRSSGVDTKNLAEAAKKQAAASVQQVSNFAALAIAAKGQSEQAIAQTKQMSESLNKTDSIIRQATIQASAANKLAEASGKQVITADKTFALAAEVDRPWIGFSAVTASPPITEGKGADVVLYVVNAGRRPARTLEFRASANVFEQFPNDPPYSLSPGESPRPSHSIVVPGGGLGAPFKSTAYPSHIVERMKSGNITFYIYGSIVYEDLGTGKPHTTKICQFFIPSKGTYGWCPEYNDAN